MFMSGVVLIIPVFTYAFKNLSSSIYIQRILYDHDSYLMFGHTSTGVSEHSVQLV